MARLALVAAVALGGCAASNAGDCDPQASASCAVDASTRDLPIFYDAVPTVDVITVDGPNLSFGDTCTDKSQCASRVCIFSGVSGYCSDLCSAGSCPSGYGCYGVLGVIEPGQVSNVCVKESNLLCTSCTASEECSAVSRDLCIPSATGGSFCARDCTTIECPTGYVCSDVTVGQNTFKQCLPASGACDCNVMNAGAKKACDIETPFGKCTGARTCLGGAGWGDCTPPAPTDEPDATFGDANCDGIDGDIAGGIFVSPGGTDSGTCGLVYTDPCQTIGFAEGRAATVGRAWLYAQAGTYDETVVLREGVHIAGGYDGEWKRAERTAGGHETRIVGQSYDGEAIAVVARNLGAQTRVLDVVIYAPAGSGARADLWAAKASYGVHALNANISLERVTINQANGANGARGGDGADAPNPNAVSGMNGCPYNSNCPADHMHDSDAVEELRCCSSERKPGGGVGVNVCGGYAGGNTTAGVGGSGGAMDSGCGGFPDCSGGATAGANGQFAGWWSNTPGNIYGTGGTGSPGTGDTSQPGGRGADGTHFNGQGGTGGTGGGHIVDGKYWYAWKGGGGFLGFHGSGGGGGGGSGGSDSGTDSTGAGGGGGGAGGCAAQAPGGGGQGGGGSFGVFAVGSTVIARLCTITRADGGLGGPGGTGGRGQSGGFGSAGGLGSGDSSQGGIGGNGGHGGHAGGGGGGAGGVSFGVYYNSSTIDVDSSNSISGSGNGGGGGGGGPSAPSAPPTERDGNAGFMGPMGGSGTLHNCANPAGC
jgi:hypothetical protein